MRDLRNWNFIFPVCRLGGCSRRVDLWFLRQDHQAHQLKWVAGFRRRRKTTPRPMAESKTTEGSGTTEVPLMTSVKVVAMRSSSMKKRAPAIEIVSNWDWSTLRWLGQVDEENAVELNMDSVSAPSAWRNRAKESTSGPLSDQTIREFPTTFSPVGRSSPDRVSNPHSGT